MHQEPQRPRVVELDRYDMSPEDYKRRYGYYPNGYVNTTSYVAYNDDVSRTSDSGVHPKEYVHRQEDRMQLPEVNSVP